MFSRHDLQMLIVDLPMAAREINSCDLENFVFSLRNEVLNNVKRVSCEYLAN